MPENLNKQTASTPSEDRSPGTAGTSAEGYEKKTAGSMPSNRTADGQNLGSEEQSLVGKAQESGREIASRSVQAVSDRTRATTDTYMQEVSTGLHTLAEGLRQTSSSVQGTGFDQPLSNAGARYLEGLAGKVEDFSSYLERKDLTAIYSDVRGFARDHPAVFVGGAFALGFAVSRLLKSGNNSDEITSTRGH